MSVRTASSHSNTATVRVVSSPRCLHPKCQNLTKPLWRSQKRKHQQTPDGRKWQLYCSKTCSDDHLRESRIAMCATMGENYSNHAVSLQRMIQRMTKTVQETVSAIEREGPLSAKDVVKAIVKVAYAERQKAYRSGYAQGFIKGRKLNDRV